MQAILNKQHRQTTKTRRTKGENRTAGQPAWRPQASSLTRDELRRIVLDTLG